MADSLLKFNPENNTMWVLKVTEDRLTRKMVDQVVQLKWDSSKKKADDDDVLQSYVSEAKESEIITYRQSGFKCADVYFAEEFKKLILLSGNYLATIYDFNGADQDPKKGVMRKRKLLGLTRQIYLVKGESDNEVYLVQASKKDLREIDPKEAKKVPDGHAIFEL